MKRSFISVLAMLVLVSLSAVQSLGQGNKNSAVKPPQKKKAPVGVVIKGNGVTAKAGYALSKESDGTVVVARKNKSTRPVITGRFKCSCTKSSNPNQTGSCEFGTIGGDKAQCYSASNCSTCSLETIVSPPKAVIQ